MEFKDYYQALGVKRDASTDEIKKAYRRLARKYHPDVSDAPDAEARFKAINEAHEVLKDPEKRRTYDQFGSQWKAASGGQGGGFRPPPGWQNGFEFRSGGGQSGFSDFFETLFGNFGRQPGGPSAARAAGQDQQASITIDLGDSYHGASRSVTLQTPERQPDGQLRNVSRTLKVKIPAGITAGKKIRLAGQGSAGGDLYLEVGFRPHPLFQADGKDVSLELPIAPWEAALGASVQVPTLGGRVELRIPAGAQSGQKLRLKGRGLPGAPAGDQYVVLKIVTPKADSERLRELYQALAQESGFTPRAGLGSI